MLRTRRPQAVSSGAADRRCGQPVTDVMDLDRVDAANVGRLPAASGTADVVASHVAICARPSRQRVVIADPEDVRRLDPRLRLVTV